MNYKYLIKRFILVLIFTLILGLNSTALIKAQEKFEPSEEVNEQEPEIPKDIRGIIPDQDFIDSFCYALKWKSVEMYNTFDVAEKLFQEAKNKALEIGINLSLSNISDLKNEADQKINAVCNAATIDDALLALKDFMNFAQNRIRQSFEGLRHSIEEPMKIKGKELQQKIESQIKESMEGKRAEIEDKIKQEIVQEQEKLQQEMTEKIQKGELSPEEAQNWIQQKIQEKTQELTKKEMLEMPEVSEIPELKEKIMPLEVQKFKEIGKFFKNIVKQLQDAKKRKNPQADEFKKLALEKRKEITFKILDKKIAEVIKQIKNKKNDIEELRKMNPDIPTADEIINEMQNDIEILKTKLSEAIEKSDEGLFEKLINDFKMKWENKRKEMGQKQNAKIICSFAIEKIKNAKNQIQKALNQLIEAKKNCWQREDIEQCNKFNKNIDLANKFIEQLNQILSSINEAENLCKQVSEDTPPDQIVKVLNNLKNQEIEINTLKEKFNNLIK